jgi:DNA-binding response OmpR family regulator
MAAQASIATRGNLRLVVLDLMLPDIDGLEVCHTIRARAGTRS